MLFIHKFAPDHCNLGDWATPSKKAKAKEAAKELSV
jgi:hypothetical protein